MKNNFTIEGVGNINVITVGSDTFQEGIEKIAEVSGFLINEEIYYMGIIPYIVYKGVEPVSIDMGGNKVAFKNCYMRGGDWNLSPGPVSFYPKPPTDFKFDVSVEFKKTSASKKGDGALIVIELLIEIEKPKQSKLFPIMCFEKNV